MKKIKLFLFILVTILIPSIVMAKDIDNYMKNVWKKFPFYGKNSPFKCLGVVK